VINLAKFSEINTHAVALFRRNHLYRFEGMQLGLFWHVFMPCLPIVLYNILNVLGVFHALEGSIPRSITISIGIMIYFAFSESLVGCNNCLEINKNYISKTGLGFSACYLSVVYAVVMNMAIRYTVIFLLLLFYSKYLTVYFIWGLAICLLSVLFGTVCGVIFSVFSLFYKDISNLVQTLSFYLLFASGVFGTMDDSSTLGSIVSHLPSYIYVVNGRNLILGLGEVDASSILFLAAISLLLGGAAFTMIRNAKSLMLNYIK